MKEDRIDEKYLKEIQDHRLTPEEKNAIQEKLLQRWLAEILIKYQKK